MHQCDAVRVCPTKAVFWNENASRLEIDNSKCIGCGQCARVCPIAAIKVAKTQAQLDEYKAEIDADPRRAEDLFVDRYGAGAVETKPLQPEHVAEFVVSQGGDVCIELNQDDKDLVCFMQAIPISEIMDLEKIAYRACENGREIMAGYDVGALPALVFFRDGAQIGKIEGFYENSESEKALLRRQVAGILGA
jgi:Fe-S-cluster-containing hydrogenase component 2